MAKFFNDETRIITATIAQNKLKKLDDLYNKFNVIQEKIVDQLDKGEENAEINMEIEAEMEIVDDQYNQIAGKAHKIIQDQKQKKQEQTGGDDKKTGEANEIMELQEQIAQLKLLLGKKEKQPSAESHKKNDNAETRIKLPKFDSTHPQLWFSQVELTLEMNGISDDHKKYNQVFINLEGESLNAIEDIIVNPPAQDKYETIKKRIISRFSESAEQRLRQLLHGQVPSGKKPSEVLAHMEALAQGHLSATAMRETFLEKMPAHIKNVLCVSSEDLKKLAQMADKIYEVNTPNINTISPNNQRDPNATTPSTGEPASLQAISKGNSELGEVKELLLSSKEGII